MARTRPRALSSSIPAVEQAAPPAYVHEDVVPFLGGHQDSGPRPSSMMKGRGGAISSRTSPARSAASGTFSSISSFERARSVEVCGEGRRQ